MSATVIVQNLDKLQAWKAALESDLNNSTALHSKNSTIQNIIDLFTNIRIKTSVTDEILIEHLRRDTREKNIDEITSEIKIAIKKLREQRELVDSLPGLLDDIKSQSEIIYYDTDLHETFLLGSVDELLRIETCYSDRSLGRHVLRLPYGIAVDIKRFNPIAYGVNKPIVIRAKKPKWRSVDVYCSDRLQYSIKVDNMNLNINEKTIKINKFRDVKDSIRNVDTQ